MDDEALIEAVIRTRLAGESAADVHAKLSKEGAEVTMQQVKKACSKAGKRQGGAPGAAAAEPVAEPAVKVDAKKEARKAKLDAAALKSAESAMLDTQLKLKRAKDPNAMDAHMPPAQMEAFMQQQTKLALSSTLAPGDSFVLKERVEADIAMLEWVRLASTAGQLRLSEDVVALGGELQLQRLRDVRDTRDAKQMRALYVDAAQKVVDAEGNVDYGGMDRMMAREDALAAGPVGGEDAMDDVD